MRKVCFYSIFGLRYLNLVRAMLDIKEIDDLKELTTIINNGLSSLDKKEKRIIVARFGLKTGKPLTIKETGKKYNISPERARQIESIGLAKMRIPKNKKLLRKFIRKEDM